MKVSRKMWLMIVSKITKIQDFTLSLKNTYSEKPQEGGGESSWLPPTISGSKTLNKYNEKRIITLSFHRNIKTQSECITQMLAAENIQSMSLNLTFKSSNVK